MSRSSQLDLGPARPLTIPAGPSSVAALAAGPDDAVAPVALLVPGFTGSKEDFGPLFEPLTAAGLRVVAIDLPGQFESPGPDDPDTYSVTALGSVVAAVAAHLSNDTGVHLLGHSFGGLVARAAVLADAERFASLVLLDSGPSGLGGGRRERLERMRPVLAAHGVAGVYAAQAALESAEPGWVPRPPELEAFLRHRFVAGSPAGLLGMGDALVSEPDLVDDLAAGGPPILVVYGADDDAWSPAVQAEMAQRLGAPTVVIEDAAHSPAVESPADTARALIDFWLR